ncbi:hypothetical protein VNI00_010378 [Paramarasmius palmivorus]|uniref:Uncharacterized protein n=1 Tax=Paramarasmius palmivorus TaxID=297713 RepID=A0AAW0CJK3_9AGAR
MVVVDGVEERATIQPIPKVFRLRLVDADERAGLVLVCTRRRTGKVSLGVGLTFRSLLSPETTKSPEQRVRTTPLFKRKAIRAVHHDPITPILIFGGHTHIRDCLQLDGDGVICFERLAEREEVYGW